MTLDLCLPIHESQSLEQSGVLTRPMDSAMHFCIHAASSIDCCNDRSAFLSEFAGISIGKDNARRFARKATTDGDAATRSQRDVE